MDIMIVLSDDWFIEEHKQFVCILFFLLFFISYKKKEDFKNRRKSHNTAYKSISIKMKNFVIVYFGLSISI